MSLAITIPTLETDRLILRAPQIADTDPFHSFLESPRAHFVGGGTTMERRAVIRSFGHIAGLWVMRGLSSFILTLKGDDRGIGLAGPWQPADFPEVEFGWSLWSAEHEGKGYITEAMRVLIPWTWANSDLETAISVIDDGNDASVRVAKRLGATFDTAATEAANTEGSPFYSAERPAVVYRHRKDAA